MCVWDFNSACDNYQESPVQTDGVLMQYGLWYEMLFKDQEITERVIRRYHELRDTYFSREYLFDFIDSSAAYLGDAAARNYALWGNHAYLLPLDRNPASYEESIQQIKDFLNARISFLDENIEMLRQYSAESKIKKYNEISN